MNDVASTGLRIASGTTCVKSFSIEIRKRSPLQRESARAVDKQLQLAKDTIGTTSRFEAARLFAEYEAGVEGFYPPSVAPSRPAFWPLPMPVPTKARPTNALTWRQVLAWGVIIAVAAPVAITVAAMLILALALLFGVHSK